MTINIGDIFDTCKALDIINNVSWSFFAILLSINFFWEIFRKLTPFFYLIKTRFKYRILSWACYKILRKVSKEHLRKVMGNIWSHLFYVILFKPDFLIFFDYPCISLLLHFLLIYEKVVVNQITDWRQLFHKLFPPI